MTRSAELRPRVLRLLFVLALCAYALLTLASAGLAASPSEPGTSPATAVPATAPPSPSPAASLTTSPAPGGATTAPCPIPDPRPTDPPGGTPRPQNLCPAVVKGADPTTILAWLFTPIFQALFLALAISYKLLGDIGLAIVVTTIAIRLLLVPVFRSQIVSQRRMQLLQPELRAIQAKYKGNRQKVSEEQMRLYRERGVNPAAGCLPALLQLGLLIPMYSVFNEGLKAPEISAMLQILGQPIIDIACQVPGSPDHPCIDPTVRWLFGLQANQPEILGGMLIPGVFGFSVLAAISAFLQLVQTRMMTPANTSNDPQIRTQQRIFLILPLISLFYGWFLPSGLFIYWIVTTVFSIVQQYLIAGWGGLFPLFGWTPGFARDHKPRFPITPVTPRVENGGGPEPPPTRRSPTDRAAGTIRPARSKGRTSRRGRRR
jgi:YidC/Oxa1 family membrane protein insertase